MSTVLSKRYAHLCSEFYKGLDQNGPYYDVVYLFDDWFDADSAANEMMGKVTVTGGVGGTVTRIVPHQHPLSPNLYCQTARVEGVGRPVVTPAGTHVTKPDGSHYLYPGGSPVMGQDGMPNFDGGFKVQATYRVPNFQYQGSDDPFNQQAIDPASPPILWCTQEVDWETETVTCTNSVAKWQSDGKPTGQPTRIQLGITVMVLTFHQVPFLPVGKIRSLRGKVNSGTFLGAAQGTVLFMGGRTRREFNTDGTVNQQVVMTFKERDQAWSKSLRPSTMLWDVVTTDGSTPIYSTADFTPLIQF